MWLDVIGAPWQSYFQYFRHEKKITENLTVCFCVPHTSVYVKLKRHCHCLDLSDLFFCSFTAYRKWKITHFSELHFWRRSQFVYMLNNIFKIALSAEQALSDHSIMSSCHLSLSLFSVFVFFKHWAQQQWVNQHHCYRLKVHLGSADLVTVALRSRL